MPSYEGLFPGKYLKASDVKDRGSVSLTIRELVPREKIEGGSGDVKPVLYFERTKRGLVLNKTNATAIAELYGDDYSSWPGKVVTLVVRRVDFQGRYVDALRIEMPQGTPQRPQAPGVSPVAAPPSTQPDNLGGMEGEEPPFPEDADFDDQSAGADEELF